MAQRQLAGVPFVENLEDLLWEPFKLAEDVAALVGTSMSWTFTVPEDQVWDIVLVAVNDITSGNTTRTIRPIYQTGAAGVRPTVTSGETSAWDASNLEAKKEVGVAANTTTIWEPQRRMVLYPGDQLVLAVSGATIGDHLTARALLRRRWLRG